MQTLFIAFFYLAERSRKPSIADAIQILIAESIGQLVFIF